MLQIQCNLTVVRKVTVLLEQRTGVRIYLQIYYESNFLSSCKLNNIYYQFVERFYSLRHYKK